MTYNIDFLIAAMVILLLVLWYFLGQKRAEDLNNQVFLFFAIIGILDVVAELASNYYISFPNSNCEIAAMLATTIFYLLQALLPFTVICYIQTLHDNKIISAKMMFLSGVILIVIWRKKLGYRKVKVLLEILLISGSGLVIQLLYHPLLTTGFGMSLGILALFITINNPHANIDTLTGSLEEYEYYLTQLKRMFDGNSKLNVYNKIITVPVIISGIMNAQKLGDSGLILEYAEYLEALSAKNGLTEVIQDDYQTMNGFLYNKRVEQYLHKAITEDLFEIYYQPVYSTRKKCFITLEALSRLQHPELGWIAPDVFIQIAEKNHMIEQITDLQFSRVCRFLGENRYLMRHLLNVKVNLSSLDLMRNDCSRHFIRIMDAYKIPHNWIQFEFTESGATECIAGLR